MTRISAMLAALVSFLVPMLALAQQDPISVPGVFGKLLVNPVTNKVYVSVQDSRIAVIDAATNTPRDLVIDPSARVVALDPVANNVYAIRNGALLVIDPDDNVRAIPVTGVISAVVPNTATGGVYLITKSGGTVGTVPDVVLDVSIVADGVDAAAAAFNPVTNRIYAVGSGTVNGSGSPAVLEIDPATNSSTAIAIPTSAQHVVVNPVANRIYAGGGSATPEVYAIDGATHAITTTPIANGPGIVGLALNPATNRVYVINHGFVPGAICNALGGNGGFTEIDGQTGTVLHSAAIINPNGIALDPVTNRVYITETGCFGVGLGHTFDPDAGTLSLFSPGHPEGDIAVNPLTNRIYVSDFIDRAVRVLDASINMKSTWVTGAGPAAIDVNPITDAAYVANSQSNTVTAIGGVFNTLPTSLSSTVPVGSVPRSVAVDPAANRIYTANAGSNDVTVIDGNTHATSSIPIAATAPNTVAVNPVTRQLLVASGASVGNNPGALTVLDADTNTPSREVQLAPAPVSIAVNIATNRVYLPSVSTSLHIVDAGTGGVTTLTLGARALAVAVNRTTNQVFVGVENGPMAIIDGDTDAVTTLDVGFGSQRAVAVDPVTNRVYVAKSNGQVAVVDLDRFTVRQVDAGADPLAVAVDSMANRVYVANGSAGTATIIDGATLQATRVQTEALPSAIAVSPVAGSAYVVNRNANSVTEIRASRPSLTNHAVDPTVTPPIGGGTVTRLAQPTMAAAGCCAYAPNDPAVRTLFYTTGNTQGRFARALGTATTFATMLLDAVPGMNYVKLFTLDTMSGVPSASFAPATVMTGMPRIFPFMDIAPVITTPAMLPDAFINTPYTVALSAVGPAAPRQFVLESGAFPPGLALSTSGVITGTPTANGFFAFTVAVSDASGGSTSRVFGILVDAAAGPTLANISTRAAVGSGNNLMIGGFVIGGSAAKTVLVTAAGPALRTAGISNPIEDPSLTLVRSADQSVVTSNDDWVDAPNADAIRASGFAPASRLEPAVLVSLEPGAYTALVKGGTGTGLVAVYEVDHPEVPLTNISTRAQVLTGNDVVIAGFVIQGDAPQTVVVTGIGPSLAAAGIANRLLNPMLTLVRSSDGAVIASNDNWGQAPNASQIQAAGLAPANPLESAIMATLQPGAYTAILSGFNGGTGVGIVAVYRR
jgi:YVTN family beta-propeller protein